MNTGKGSDVRRSGDMEPAVVATEEMAELLTQLHQLRLEAGLPSVRDIAKRDVVTLSATTVHKVLSGVQTRWENLAQVVMFLAEEARRPRPNVAAPEKRVDREVDRFKKLWMAARLSEERLGGAVTAAKLAEEILEQARAEAQIQADEIRRRAQDEAEQVRQQVLQASEQIRRAESRPLFLEGAIAAAAVVFDRPPRKIASPVGISKIPELERAAAGGDVASMLCLSHLLAEKDPQASEKWLDEAVQGASDNARVRLAGRVHDEQAIHLLWRPAENGYPTSVDALGELLSRTREKLTLSMVERYRAIKGPEFDFARWLEEQTQNEFLGPIIARTLGRYLELEGHLNAAHGWLHWATVKDLGSMNDRGYAAPWDDGRWVATALRAFEARHNLPEKPVKLRQTSGPWFENKTAP